MKLAALFVVALATAAATVAFANQQRDQVKSWCFASWMSDADKQASFKQLVGSLRAGPIDQSVSSSTVDNLICRGLSTHKNPTTGKTLGKDGPDSDGSHVAKDSYLDALVACENSACTEHLLKILKSERVDPIRSAYLQTRLAIDERH